MKYKFLQLSALIIIFAAFTSYSSAQNASPILDVPPNLEDDVSLTPEFDWDNIRGTVFYDLVVFTDNDIAINTVTFSSFYYNQNLILVPNTTYHWKVRGHNFISETEWSDVWDFTTSARGDNKFSGGNNIPNVYSLHQNFPNPFNPVTKIKFDLPKDSYVKLSVFDITGKVVEVLADGILSAGSHDAVWFASNFGSGVYFYRLEAGSFTEMRKMIVVK